MRNSGVFLYLIILGILLNACGNSEAGKILRNQKSATGDEFLIKKNDPLTQPPDYKSIPSPSTLSSKEKKETNELKRILDGSKDTDVEKKSRSTNVENSILNQIKK